MLDSNTISAITNSNRNVGEVYGKSLSAQEFYEMVNEASEVTKLRSGGTLTDEQTDMVRNQVWNDYVQYELIKHECDKLGVLVTDKDEKMRSAKVAHRLSKICPCSWDRPDASTTPHFRLS